jgi:hypothetical protein
MKRKILNVLWIPSLIGCIAVCWLWVSSFTSIDSASITYDRYLSDGRTASNAVYLTSDHRLWINILAGTAPPYDGKLVRGYYVSADMSKGKPVLRYDRSPYATNIFLGDGRVPTNDSAMSGWGPFRWDDFRRTDNGEQFRFVTVGVSHWMVLLPLLLLPFRKLHLRLCSDQATAVELNGEQENAPELRASPFLKSVSLAATR